MRFHCLQLECHCCDGGWKSIKPKHKKQYLNSKNTQVLSKTSHEHSEMLHMRVSLWSDHLYGEFVSLHRTSCFVAVAVVVGMLLWFMSQWSFLTDTHHTRNVLYSNARKKCVVGRSSLMRYVWLSKWQKMTVIKHSVGSNMDREQRQKDTVL